ncbi:MAG: retroviral-like aspartic protease family protein [Treponema sp.]|nr:retroviral-like aspartic protease family protein [Treponema sp.]
MSIIQTEITIKNISDKIRAEEGLIKETNIRKVTVNAIIDTGAWTLVINEYIRDKLGLKILGMELQSLANGAVAEYSIAGPVEIRWKNRRVTCDALVLPDADDVLLGVIPLEAMDLTINPRRELAGVHGDFIMHKLKSCHFA